LNTDETTHEPICRTTGGVIWANTLFFISLVTTT